MSKVNLEFSVVICTDGRASALSNTLRSLRYLGGPEFEVCVVRGPCEDGTEDVLSPWLNQLKVARNPERNLSISRNLGISMAAGEIIAFLDDDAIPEPEWLQDLAAAFADPRVGGAGGFVYNHTGKEFQYRFATTNRLGDADLGWERATPEFCFPYSANYPHLLGTNSSFRRAAILEVGGFDEEFEYYLDETDLCCRIVDLGWEIRQLSNAFVHHKFLPSRVRNEHRILRRWYPIIKNKIYFSLVNGRHHHSMQMILESARTFVQELRSNVATSISEGYLVESDRDRFEIEADRAWQDGLVRGLTARKKRGAHLSHGGLDELPVMFDIFERAEEKLTVCLINLQYGDHRMSRAARYICELARGLAALGHRVHMLAPGVEQERVDVEEDVWVHRIITGSRDRPAPPEGTGVPLEIWNWSATVFDEVSDIAERRRVDCVYAPLGDCKGIALLLDSRFRLITFIPNIAPLSGGQDTEWTSDSPHADVAGDVRFRLESRMLQESHMLHGESSTAAREAAALHGIVLDETRLALGRLGEGHWAAFAAREQGTSRTTRSVTPTSATVALAPRGQPSGFDQS